MVRVEEVLAVEPLDAVERNVGLCGEFTRGTGLADAVRDECDVALRSVGRVVVDVMVRDVVGVDGTPVPVFDAAGREVVDDFRAEDEAGLRRPLDTVPGWVSRLFGCGILDDM